MSFIQKTVGTEKGFGSDLAELRHLRRWSREDLSRVTRIHVSIIQALEDERFYELSDLVYTERHVRLIVEALEGRVPFFLHKYRQAVADCACARKRDGTVYSFLSRVRRRELFTTTSYLPLLLFIPLAFLLAWYVWAQVVSLVANPVLEVVSPADHQRTTEAFIDVKGRTNPSATVTVNGNNAIVESDGSFYSSVSIPRGTTELVIKSQRRYSGSSEVIRYVVYEPVFGPYESVIEQPLSIPTTTSANPQYSSGTPE